MLEFLREVPESRRTPQAGPPGASPTVAPPPPPTPPPVAPAPAAAPTPAPPAPKPRVTLKPPAPKPEARPEAERTPRSEAASSGPGWASRVFRVPMSWVVIGAAILLGLVIVTWVVAYSAGEEAAKDRILARSPEDPPGGPISDPGRDINDPTIPGRQPIVPPPIDPTPNPDPKPSDDVVPEPPTPVADPDALPTTWQPGEDPRRANHNYLRVCRVPWNQAYAAVDHLTRNGVPAAAVPDDSRLDPGQAISNNALHLVIVLEAIPSGRRDLMRSRGGQLQTRVRELGQRFAEQASGNDDFSTCYWSLHRG